MLQRERLVSELASLLQPQLYNDYCPNGLQIEGTATIRKIVTGVTASQALFDAAIAANADAVIVHHGIFWNGDSAPILGTKRQRIAQLINHNINLFAYHLPLDCHLELGNNKQLADKLDITVTRQVTISQIPNLLWLGELPQAIDASDFARFIEQRLNRTPLVINPANPRKLKTLAWCTGAAQKYLDIANQYGVDAYLSGEISESTFHNAQELELTYFAAGHHATERYGIQALGSYLEKNFQIEHQYIEIDNPV